MRKIVDGKEIYHDLATLVLLLYSHARAELFGQFTFKKQKLRGQVGLSRSLRSDTASELFRVSDVQLARDDLREESLLLQGPVNEHEKRSRVAFAYFATRKRVLHFL